MEEHLLGRGVLEQEAGGARADRGHHTRPGRTSSGSPRAWADPSARCPPWRRSVAPGHAHVHQHHVRVQRARHRDGLLAVRCLAYTVRSGCELMTMAKPARMSDWSSANNADRRVQPRLGIGRPLCGRLLCHDCSPVFLSSILTGARSTLCDSSSVSLLRNCRSARGCAPGPSGRSARSARTGARWSPNPHPRLPGFLRALVDLFQPRALSGRITHLARCLRHLLVDLGGDALALATSGETSGLLRWSRSACRCEASSTGSMPRSPGADARAGRR